jgi:N-acetyl-gamma-glutamyl-phosphate reductase
MKQKSQVKHNVAIVGANGYAGIELARLLLQHPAVAELTVFTRQPTWQLQDEGISSHKPVAHYPVEVLMTHAHEYAVVFLATPVELSLVLAPQLIEKNVKVIDLSGAFRLSAHEFQQWYGAAHTAESTSILSHAVYGLSPWCTLHAQSPPVQLIANPGCYATCAQMALLPLLQSQLIDPATIIIDAKSGATGAGKKAEANLLFCELMENFYPYKVGTHQHIPEIIRYVKQYAATKIQPTLITHLLPIRRGIFMTIYVDLNEQISPKVNMSLYQHFNPNLHTKLHSTTPTEQPFDVQTVTDAYQQAYHDYPLVKFGPAQNNKPLLALKSVVGTNNIHLTYQLINHKLVIFSAMDNLLKGAASQAIENFNWLNNNPLTTGLYQNAAEVKSWC